MDIRDLVLAAEDFRRRLDDIKLKNSSPAFGWYPYDPFRVFSVLEGMLREERRDLLALAGAAPVLDVGCGDGGLSFFFESQGCRVIAIDNANPNFNATAGVRTLHRALQSQVDFQMFDLDGGVEFPGRTFGLALCLGVLYHLKNPFAVLEGLARHVRHCVLSTRIAQVTRRGTRIEDEPVAYLLDPFEANNDSSNYWIFSEAGLRRILERTGWEICDYTTIGPRKSSNPSDQDRDQRAFCLLRSAMPDPWLGVDIEGGWHAMENGSWRWTERTFAVRLRREHGERLRFRFTLPEAVLRETGPLELRSSVNGEWLGACRYDAAGEHVYEQVLPERALEGRDLSIRFEFDKALAPRVDDAREIVAQVVFWSYDEKAPRALNPITVA